MTDKKDTSLILAFESSCDDTAIALMKDSKILANEVISQKIHENFGGVVPELASRAHTQNIVPLISYVLEKTNVKLSDVTKIAYTEGPGLKGSLLVGIHFAKTLAWSLNIPSQAINHLVAHVAALFIQKPDIKFPFICLLVSGGHTQIILIESFKSFKIIGETLDDAVGEAFDKGSKMLGLSYPGGPVIDKLALSGNPNFVEFPKNILPNFQFSYSGLKTSLLYYLQKQTPEFIQQNINDICASWQQALIYPLIIQIKKAAIEHRVKIISIAGGVSANSLLRKEIIALAEKKQWEYIIPNFEYCTDNAAMIAAASYYNLPSNL